MSTDPNSHIRALWKHSDSSLLNAGDWVIQSGRDTLGYFGSSPFTIDPPLLAGQMMQTSSDMTQAAGAAGTNTSNLAAAPLNDTFSATNASGLGITIQFDTGGTNSNAPAGFQSSVEAAVQYFESEFAVHNPINLTLHVGYGEIGGWGGSSGTALGPSELGRSENHGYFYNYTQVKSALQARSATPDEVAAYNSLPPTDPVGSNTNYRMADAEAQALGLESSSSPTDGSIGFGNGDPVTWGTTNQAATGTYDGFGIVEHEISEVLGRTGNLGTGPTPFWTILDLFRYSSAGARELSPAAGYFSLDNGSTNLGTFNNPSSNNGGDAGDWDNSVPNDSFDAFTSGDAPARISALDNRVMDVLGYQPVACFAAGTRILTADGEVPVEHLTVGTRVVTQQGDLVPVRWIGHRRIACARHPEPDCVIPIRIAADAFGPGAPCRDLLLSPDHAVLLDGALVPVRLLVNHASIAPVPGCQEVWYFHVEFERHDVLFADGLAAESYIDTGNRGMFENGDASLQLHPMRVDPGAQARRERESCLPLACDPEWVEPRWRRLAERSGSLGYVLPEIATTADPELCLLIGTRRVTPTWHNGERYVFVLPRGPAPVRLVSRSVIPAALRPWMEDRRRLGVMLRGLTLRTGSTRVEIAVDHPALRDGWWQAEQDATALWRWSNGDAALPAACGGGVLEVRIGTPTMGYPVVQDAVAKQRAA